MNVIQILSKATAEVGQAWRAAPQASKAEFDEALKGVAKKNEMPDFMVDTLEQAVMADYPDLAKIRAEQLAASIGRTSAELLSNVASGIGAAIKAQPAPTRAQVNEVIATAKAACPVPNHVAGGMGTQEALRVAYASLISGKPFDILAAGFASARQDRGFQVDAAFVPAVLAGRDPIRMLGDLETLGKPLKTLQNAAVAARLSAYAHARGASYDDLAAQFVKFYAPTPVEFAADAAELVLLARDLGLDAKDVLQQFRDDWDATQRQIGSEGTTPLSIEMYAIARRNDESFLSVARSYNAFAEEQSLGSYYATVLPLFELWHNAGASPSKHV